MKTTYFGFAIADSMFPPFCSVVRAPLEVSEVRDILAKEGVVPCLNPSHVATIAAMQQKFGIAVEIPATPSKVELKEGDSLLVMSVRGLPRLTDRHEYTDDEVASAEFAFAKWSVVA